MLCIYPFYNSHLLREQTSRLKNMTISRTGPFMIPDFRQGRLSSTATPVLEILYHHTQPA